MTPTVFDDPLYVWLSPLRVSVAVALFTVRDTVSEAELYALVSVGVKLTCSVCVPASSTVPAAGVYEKLPATEAVASSSLAPSAVP